ncbi:MAG: hypothetical protein JNM17_08280 [Archangium sp.]|nr:hypothetical protein [Archangium sp.]
MKTLLCVSVMAATPALAWESTCSKFTNRTLEPDALASASREPCTPSAGPATARERWIGPGDEHRQLFELTRQKAGLPAEVSATKNLTVFTSDGLTDIAGTGVPTLVPSAAADIKRVAYRSFSIAEFSQLPDFSYALWDWASGHEVCPVAGANSISECHDFAAHMGPVNSNHFLPQSRTNYAHYHALALARAADCASMASRIAGQPRFQSYARACEIEALVLESIGQHYLQDSWSMGHMWGRWGSSTLEDFPGDTIEEKRDRAVLTALVSGLFHGARSVLQSLPQWTSYDVNDAMCAPWDDVKFKTPSGAFSNGVGDNYLSLFSDRPAYGLQNSTFFQCSVSGLLEVYTASGQQHGAAVPAPGFMSIDPTSDVCFGQRATNASLAAGAAVNLKIAGLQTTIPIDARFVSFMLPKVARAQGKVAVPPKVRNEFRFELQRAVTVARLKAKDDPEGTQLANGEWGSFMGVQQNQAYDTVASYLDAPWPWNATDERTQYLARTFHQAHATELCSQVDVAALDALRVRAHDMTAPIEEQVAACTACSELAVRHLRVGTSAASYDTANEPLCASLVTTPAFLYAQFSGVTDPTQTASRWCCQ